MINLENKMIIKWIFLIVVVCLFGIYLGYDFQSQQILKEDVANLKNEMLASQNRSVDAIKSKDILSKEMLITEGELIRVGGIIKNIENTKIVLEGQIILEGKSKYSLKENKEYQIVVNSETKIIEQNKEIKLKNLKNGNRILVFGQADFSNKQEIAANTITLMPDITIVPRGPIEVEPR